MKRTRPTQSPFGMALETRALWAPLRQVRARNADRSVIHETVRKNARAHGLSNAQIKLITNAINYKNAANMEKHLDQATAWLRKKVRRRRYALIARHSDAAEAFRSSEWLMHRAIRGIGKWPSAFISVEDYEDPRHIVEAIASGIKVFVIFDDAVYSGKDMFGDFVGPFEKAVWHMKEHGLSTKGLSLYLAAGYFSGLPNAQNRLADVKKGLDRIARHIAQKKGLDGVDNNDINVEFFAPGRMASVADFAATLRGQNKRTINNYLSRFELYDPYENKTYHSHEPLNNPNRQLTMTMLASKVPNSWSFQGRLSQLLTPMFPSPYKRFKSTNIPLASRIVNSRRQGSHIVHTYANGSVRKYVNRGGELHPANAPTTRKRPRRNQ